MMKSTFSFATLCALIMTSLVSGFVSQSAFTSNNNMLSSRVCIPSSDSLMSMNAAERTYIMVSAMDEKIGIMLCGVELKCNHDGKYSCKGDHFLK